MFIISPQVTTPSSPQAFQPPVPQQNYTDPNVPHCSVVLPGNVGDPAVQQESAEGGVWGWFKGNQILNKFAEKAKVINYVFIF